MRVVRGVSLLLWATLLVGLLVLPRLGDAAEPEGRHYEVTVEGMSCPLGCATRVRDLVSRIEGVRAVEVDFGKKMVAVDCDPGATLTAEAVQAVFSGTPYSVKSIREAP